MADRDRGSGPAGNVAAHRGTPVRTGIRRCNATSAELVHRTQNIQHRRFIKTSTSLHAVSDESPLCN